ncbi:putative PMR5 domain, PC-Esterase, protein trichome birefringence-like 34 [Helianthus annuus]|nr:putative PMR5 domain, PC-Esterase, protein trichome birefringence-like 34 [Helianthus annuus]
MQFVFMCVALCERSRTMGKMNCSIGLCDMQTMIHCSIFIFFLGGLSTMSFYRNNKQDVARKVKESTLSLSGTCDLFSGRWVHDNKSYYPLYKEHECPYLEENFACQTYGRKDSKYLQWRWQPMAATSLERLRGKRLLFVGDSLNRNQWNSMICMLHSSIPGVKRAGGGLKGHLHTFRASDYNISIDFYWAPMLVESNGDNPKNHHAGDYRIVGIKAIEKHARHWVDADILIFNSYHWWRVPEVKLLKSGGSLLYDTIQEYEEVDSLRAYNMGLKTWSDWAHTHIDPSKTKLFFMGVTATHSSKKQQNPIISFQLLT